MPRHGSDNRPSRVCPHCGDSFFAEVEAQRLTHMGDKRGLWEIEFCICPSCRNITLELLEQSVGQDAAGTNRYRDNARHRVFPRSTQRRPVPQEVPDGIAQDYTEACLVIGDSPKASAALGRRCLQHILREAAGVKKPTLEKEIQAVIDEGKLPSALAQSIDAIRHLGNFSAHPTKSENTGEIVDVEPGEAEWTLDVLEALFDHFYVQPALLQAKRDALNEKLKEAGKPPLK